MTAAIMDRLAGRDGYQRWINEHVVYFDGSVGLYSDVIELARKIVSFEIEHGGASEDFLYHFADAASDWMFNEISGQPPDGWFESVQTQIPIELE